MFPAFLFDTLAPFESSGTQFPMSGQPLVATVQVAAPIAAPNRGGRPAEHDWNTFTMEIIRKANQPDGLPETQAELVREMLMWFQEKYGREPADSAVKDRISKIYRYLHEAKNPVG